ncbi:MAG: U32 family peptidase C-terminal domain-containing protein, partial [Thermotogota bacterium]|nr:U32 family peptidase C-terminal domain-containing protein [Thermotogota bacterium]
NSKDLCTIDFLDKIIETGVDSLKIEGRMKSSYYAGVTTKVFRQAIDSYYNKEYTEELLDRLKKELESVSHREYTSGFYFHKPDENSQNYKTSSYVRNYKFVGKIIDKISENQYAVDVRNKIEKGEELEIITKKGENTKVLLDQIVNLEDGCLIDSANPNQKIILKGDNSLDVGDLIRVPIR